MNIEEPKDLPHVKSLVAKMKIYNMTEKSFREAMRSVADSGIDIRYHGTTVEWLRAHEQGDMVDYVAGIGETQYRNLLKHYGVSEVGNGMHNEQLDVVPGTPGEAPAAPASPDVKDAPPKLPTEEEIMAAMFDAFEQDVNITDKKKLIKWFADHKYAGVAQWFETLERADFYKSVSSFFANLGKVRERLPEVLSGDLKEQGPLLSPSASEPPPETAAPAPEEPASEIPPDVALDAPPEDDSYVNDAPFKKEDIYTTLMDMYLEGVDVTRRAMLVGDLDKNGREVEAEYVDGLSLVDFYNLLSEFFKRLAKAMEQKTNGEKASERKITSAVDPDIDPEKAAKVHGFDPKKAKATWDALDVESREVALTDAGFSKNIASLYADEKWDDLPQHIQIGYIEALLSVAESKKGDLQMPFGRRRKGMRKIGILDHQNLSGYLGFRAFSMVLINSPTSKSQRLSLASWACRLESILRSSGRFSEPGVAAP